MNHAHTHTHTAIQIWRASPIWTATSLKSPQSWMMAHKKKLSQISANGSFASRRCKQSFSACRRQSGRNAYHYRNALNHVFKCRLPRPQYALDKCGNCIMPNVSPKIITRIMALWMISCIQACRYATNVTSSPHTMAARDIVRGDDMPMQKIWIAHEHKQLPLCVASERERQNKQLPRFATHVTTSNRARAHVCDCVLFRLRRWFISIKTLTQHLCVC